MKCSRTTIRALRLIQDNPGRIPNARRFAQLMWPDSPCWHVRYNVGHGSSPGAAMARSAGGYLGKLDLKGLVYYSPGRPLSLRAEGLRVLTEAA